MLNFLFIFSILHKYYFLIGSFIQIQEMRNSNIIKLTARSKLIMNLRTVREKCKGFFCLKLLKIKITLTSCYNCPENLKLTVVKDVCLMFAAR